MHLLGVHLSAHLSVCLFVLAWLTAPNTTAHTHAHPFNGPLSGTTWVGWYQKGKTNLDFTEARDSEWQLHQLGHMQVWTALQTDNHASTSLLSVIQAGCPSCCPTNSVKALKECQTPQQQTLMSIDCCTSHSSVECSRHMRIVPRCHRT